MNEAIDSWENKTFVRLEKLLEKTIDVKSATGLIDLDTPIFIKAYMNVVEFELKEILDYLKGNYER